MTNQELEILQTLVGTLGTHFKVGGIAPAYIMPSGARFMKAAHKLQGHGLVKVFLSPPAPNKIQSHYLVSIRDSSDFSKLGWVECYIHPDLTIGGA